MMRLLSSSRTVCRFVDAKKLFIPALLLFMSLAFSLACSKTDSNANSGKRESSNKKSPSGTGGTFLSNVPPELAIPEPTDKVGTRLLADYGAMFIARGDAVPPPVIIFADDAAASKWQASVKTMSANVGGVTIELQTPAMTALMEARSEAQKDGLNITPRGTDAARRSYTQTVELWESRVNPGLTHWVQEGSLTKEEAARIRGLSTREQIPEILKLEAEGIYFSKDFSKSILYSVAAPGTSQHLSMLALDVKENEDAAVRSILARHGWFQTVSSDTPHFTFLGTTEDQLLSLGLKKLTSGGRTFWVPKLD